jgi:hypothetical protein
VSVTALLQSGTSPPLESHYGLGQLPADERDAGCQVATQPLHDKALGQRHSGRGTRSEALGQSEHVVIDHVHDSGPQGIHVVTDQVYDLIDGSQLCSSPPSSVRMSQQMDIPEEVTSSSASQPLNPDADNFVMKDASLIHGGRLRPDLDKDWTNVQEVHSGTSSQQSKTDCSLWSVTQSESSTIPGHAGSVKKHLEEPLLHLTSLADDLGSSQAAPAPAKPLLRASSLKDKIIMTPSAPFIDKVLPASKHQLRPRQTFTADYFSSLHNLVAAAGIRSDGSTYPALTPNFLGARIKLRHVGMKTDRWRYHLRGYEHSEIVQHLEYGFPLGLNELPELESSTRNHGSSYSFYTHVDKFIAEEIKLGGLTGPFDKVPWWDTIISPLMTAPKKPSSRRTVYDASFGDFSLNNATPSNAYLGQPCVYTYPKIDDFRRMVLRCGRGCFLFKRDLARFFLQIPLDPVEYHRVGFLWRGLIFFFIGLAFGLRHSGLQGQKLTDALAWIHRRQGLETAEEKQFNVINYSDDLGGCETNLTRAEESFNKLKVLMDDLGLEESSKKAESPSQELVYLGVMFDSVAMEMRVPPDKLAEIKSEIGQWSRKSTITRKNLQSLLGKLFWVSRVVRLARVFMGRLLQQLRDMANTGDNLKVKLSAEARKDLKWWDRFLDHFNGIQMIIEEDPFPLELSQLLDRPYDVYAGDATPMAGGGFFGKQYWSRMLPRDLQDPSIPIHIKEFWILIVSSRLWGEDWTGRAVTLFCDNTAVVDTINHKKPKDPALLSLLREFLFVSVTYKFIPVVRKIGTKENYLADHISRRFDSASATKMFCDAGLTDMLRVVVPDKSFQLTDYW